MKYFAYGMNTNSSEMRCRCPRAQSLGAAILPDHEFRFATHADIIEYPGLETHGVLWEITKDCETALDLLEGFPHYYQKKMVTVQHQGQEIQAMTYYMTGDRPDALPSSSYLAMIMDGYHEHHVPTEQIHLSIDYIENMEYVKFPQHWDSVAEITG